MSHKEVCIRAGHAYREAFGSLSNPGETCTKPVMHDVCTGVGYTGAADDRATKRVLSEQCSFTNLSNCKSHTVGLSGWARCTTSAVQLHLQTRAESTGRRKAKCISQEQIPGRYGNGQVCIDIQLRERK
ncbi:hypothetical protein NDU88_001975 [Pleurodeles waltl]|uniref:Uncharacterized protein n=1 Tax=Pleurodeles waltl TaxID=8319 RepID=A0AAV7MLB4_PLEWA|nr:hypothetical protein NDU88_001975 [Pleurodeles waltl]